MQKFFNTLRSKLLVIYLITVIISSVILACVIASYFTRLISTQGNEMTKSTLHAISQNINTYLDDLDRVSVLPYMDDSLLTALETISDKRIQTMSDYSLCDARVKENTEFQLSLENNRDEVKSVLVIYPSGKADYYNRHSEYSIKENYNFKNEPWYRQITDADGRSVFIDLHLENYLSGAKRSNVFSIGRLIKDPNTLKPLAIIVSNINDTALNTILDSSNFGVSSFIIIQDKKGGLVYSPQPISSDLQNQIFRGNSVIDENSNKYVKISKRIDGTDWDVNVLMSYSETQNNINLIKATTFIFILMQILIGFLLFSLWSHSLTTRFSEIRNVMQIAKKGDLSARYHGRSDDEIDTVGNDLNDMIIKLGDLIARERKSFVSMKNAEYRALQSQINPHFIYNTLNGFIGLNRLGQRDILEKAILSLSGMMRYILEENEYTTLEEEFDFLTKYTNLQKIRFGDRLKTNIFLDEHVAKCKIPKLILQPIAENAIIHGIEPLDREGTLEISAVEKIAEVKRYLVITIIDNGMGFDVEKLPQVKNIGINNVQKRLNLSYENAVFELTSKIGAGTQIVIKIELEREHDV